MPPRLHRLALLALCIVCGAAWFLSVGAAESRAPAPPSYVARTWNSSDGLPHNTVMAIAQTRDGYIWAGTANGLARFDGVQFTNFSLADGLTSPSVRKLYVDREGALWIGTSNGISRWQEGRFASWTTREGLASDYIVNLAEDAEGTLWIATRFGLNRWRNHQLEREVFLADQAIQGLAIDTQGRTVVSVKDQGLRRWDGSRFITPADFPQSVPVNPNYLFHDRAHRIWISDQNVPRSISAAEVRPPIPALGGITCMTESTDGTLWIGTRDNGLFFVRDNIVRRITREDGLADNAILGLHEDAELNLWVGTRSAGLCRLRPRQVFVTHYHDEGIEVSPNSLVESPEKDIWLASYGRGLYRIDAENETKLVRQTLPELPDRFWIYPIGFTRNGSFWCASIDRLQLWKQGVLEASIPMPSELRNDSFRCVMEDQERGLWVGTWHGHLLRLCNNRFVDCSVGLPRAMITALAQQPDGVLWIGTYGGGLGRWQNGQGETLDHKRGLSSELIRALHLDSRQTLWIGTEGGGLNYLRGQEVRAVGATQGLECDTVVQILEDNAGDLWLGTYQGVLRLARRDVDALLAGRSARLHPRVFDHTDAQQSAQCNTGPNGALKARDGRLYFCTYQGVVRIDPQTINEIASSPVIRIESFTVAGHDREAEQAPALAGNTALAIAAGQQRFEFRYTALRALAPERVKFRHRLAGLEAEWTEAGTRRSSHYGYLPPGQYRFEVTAHNGDGNWNSQGASLSFVVLPHYWETWWFRALIWLAGLGLAVVLGIAVQRRRQRRILAALEQQRLIDRERARIARDMHDELGSQLTKASMIAELTPQDTASASLLQSRIQTLRQTLSDITLAMDELVWAVNPKHDTLDGLANYLLRYAQEFFAVTSIRCETDIPADLPSVALSANVRHNVFLAFKETLANAAKHSQATTVTIRLRYDSAQLQIVIADDGRGFASEQSRAWRHGLENMRARLGAVGGSCEIAAQPGQGTRVSFTLALGA